MAVFITHCIPTTSKPNGSFPPRIPIVIDSTIISYFFNKWHYLISQMCVPNSKSQLYSISFPHCNKNNSCKTQIWYSPMPLSYVSHFLFKLSFYQPPLLPYTPYPIILIFQCHGKNHFAQSLSAWNSLSWSLTNPT